MISVRHNLAEFNRALGLYADYSRKTPEDVLLKQGGKLGFALNQRLRGLAPKKGEVRAERLAALKAGEGVRVRPRIKAAILQKYSAATEISSKLVRFVRGRKKTLAGSITRKGGRRMNLTALMVEREINTRESGRGFLGISARYPRILRRLQLAKSRFGPILSEAGLNARSDTLTFEWNSDKSELSGSAAKGLEKPRARAAIAYALRDTTDDVLAYVRRKLDENARRARLK